MLVRFLTLVHGELWYHNVQCHAACVLACVRLIVRACVRLIVRACVRLIVENRCATGRLIARECNCMLSYKCMLLCVRALLYRLVDPS
jgi:hypothetical protein